MHLLVIGGTGTTGLVFVQEALKAGHRLTLYARSPGKFPSEVSNSSDVTIVEGTFEDAAAFREALSKGAEVLISFAGPRLGQHAKGTPVTKFYEDICFPSLVQNSSIRICLVTSTGSFDVLDDQWSAKWWAVRLGMQVLFKNAYDEVRGIGSATSHQSELGWTIMRLPLLTNDEKDQPVNAALIGSGHDKLFLSRKSLSAWIFQELKERKWVCQAPALSNPGLL